MYLTKTFHLERNEQKKNIFFYYNTNDFTLNTSHLYVQCWKKLISYRSGKKDFQLTLHVNVNTKLWENIFYLCDRILRRSHELKKIAPVMYKYITLLKGDFSLFCLLFFLNFVF